MPALNCLTTLERVKDWSGVTTGNDDVLLHQLIDEMSRFILSYLQRPTLFQNNFSDVYDGMGQQVQVLRHWPVISVASLTVDNISIPISPGWPNAGYILEPWDGYPPGRQQAVSLCGHEYRRGFSNVHISYTSGFVISDEGQNVPASNNYTVAVSQPYGRFGADGGVTYANGTTLKRVTANPAQGEYSLNDGMYVFAGADSGASVLITYSYVPSDIEHACMELVAERYRYKNRIGEVSKSLGGQETTSFSQKDIPDYLRTLLQPYRRIIAV